MTRQAQLTKLKETVEQGKHPMQQPIPQRKKRCQKVAQKIIELAEEAK